MSNGIAGIPHYQNGGPTKGIRGLWEDIRERADNPSKVDIALSMAPFVGPGTDVVEIAAGAEDFVKGDKSDALKRILFGIAGLALPVVSGKAIRKLTPSLKGGPTRRQRTSRFVDAKAPRPRGFGIDRSDVPSDVPGVSMDDLLGNITRRISGERAVERILSRPVTESGIRTLSDPRDLGKILEPIEGLGKPRRRPRVRKLYDMPGSPGMWHGGGYGGGGWMPQGKRWQSEEFLRTGLRPMHRKLLGDAVNKHVKDPKEAKEFIDFLTFFTGKGRGSPIALGLDDVGFKPELLKRMVDLSWEIIEDPDTPDELYDLVTQSMGVHDINPGKFGAELLQGPRKIWPWDN